MAESGAGGVFEELYLQMGSEPLVDGAWVFRFPSGAGNGTAGRGYATQNSKNMARDDSATPSSASATTESDTGGTGNRQQQQGTGQSSESLSKYRLVVQSSQANFDRDSKSKLLTELEMRDDGEKVTFSRLTVFPQHLFGDVVGMSISPSGQWKCLLRSRADSTGGGKKKTEFEFWNQAALVAVVDVTDMHGKAMIANDQFGHLAWSPCEQFVTYCAEKVLSKAEKVGR